MIRISSASLIVFVLSTSGCPSIPKEVPSGQLRPPYQVMVYAKGTPITDRPIVPGSREEQAVTKWLRSHTSGWSRDLNSYAPKIYIRGEGFTLNVSKKICVLNYNATPDAKGFTQVSRATEKDDQILALFASKADPR